MKFSFDKKDFIEQEIGADKLAVIGDDFTLNWDQFSQRVNKLCDEFTNKGYTNLKHPAIIYGHKSANMIVAIYAMMKLEIPYIPVDEIYPRERIQKVVNASKSQLIINTIDGVLAFGNTTEILLNQEKIIEKQTEKIDQKEKFEKGPLVYIIFTSGSTGEPKGVQISTEAVQSFTNWMTSDFGFTNEDVFINSAVLSFDLSVFEVMTFGALGATLILNNKECTLDPNQLIPRIKKYKGTVWVSTPSFALIYSRMVEVSDLNSIRTFLFCGEVLPHGIAKGLVTNFKNAKVINTYGPTEATVATTLVEINEEILDEHISLPVGKSKKGSRLLIENDEIIIVGPNVSVGYVNNPELNSEKFTIIDNERAFKTGDKGYLVDGMLFFNGRDDDFIKLHGYRIELNEITIALNKLSYVFHGETIALRRGGIVKKIVSLVQLDSKCIVQIDKETIKTDLAKILPVYMIPSDIKFVERIPLSQNGKADKKLLTEVYLKKNA